MSGNEIELVGTTESRAWSVYDTILHTKVDRTDTYFSVLHNPVYTGFP